jgi:hypothetical protein
VYRMANIVDKVTYHPDSGCPGEALSKGPLVWHAPKGPETVAPGKRSAARSKACQQFKSPGRVTDISVALSGLTPLISQTPGCASLARGYYLSAPPGRGPISISRTSVRRLLKFFTDTGTMEHCRVSPPETVVYPNGIGTSQGHVALCSYLIEKPVRVALAREESTRYPL